MSKHDVPHGSFLSWMGSPADRHSPLSEAMRAVTILLAAHAAGGLTTFAAVQVGVPLSVGIFGLGGIAALVVLGFVISSDTMMGANGLFLFLLGIYGLATSQWVAAEWASLFSSGCGVLFGAVLITGWLDSMTKY